METSKFYCETCKYGCMNNSTYKKHISSDKHARGGGKKMFKCTDCDYSTNISVFNFKIVGANHKGCAMFFLNQTNANRIHRVFIHQIVGFNHFIVNYHWRIRCHNGIFPKFG